MRPIRSTALAAALLATGCAAHPTPRPSTAPAPAMDADPTAAPTAPAPGVVPAANVADAALGAFCDHDHDPDHWLTQLSLWLSPAAREAYAGTDPANVPCAAVTGGGTDAPAPSTALATVTVPTDSGTYTVRLSLTEAGTWQVDHFDLPPGRH